MEAKYQIKYENAEAVLEMVATWSQNGENSLETRKNIYRLVQGVIWAIYHTDEERNAAVHRVLHFVRNYSDLAYFEPHSETD